MHHGKKAGDLLIVDELLLLVAVGVHGSGFESPMAVGGGLRRGMFFSLR